MDSSELKVNIAVIGLGYVGLPLAVEFGKKYNVLGFDLNSNRIKELSKNYDNTNEVSKKELKTSNYLKFSDQVSDLLNSNCFIVAVPTPVDEYKQPNLEPLIQASELVAKVLKKGDTVIFESTVFPGATEEVCVPSLEKSSGLKFNKDFFVGYSPERINPGDKLHKLTNIVKVTSGSNEETSLFVDTLYSSIITAGTHLASSIKVAEAAKVIENTQRDVNIALINELSILFNLLELDTNEVLEAAETKWNFLPFKPGLVGGHCIGVDPYYLTYKAQEMNYYPKIILAGRTLNDSMGAYVGEELKKLMKKKDIVLKNSKVLIMGLTFKENCPDIRNTKVIDLINVLSEEGCQVSCYDPWVDKQLVNKTYSVDQVDYPSEKNYDAIIVAVPHDKFFEIGIDQIRSFGKDNHVLYDLKSIFPKNKTDLRL